MNKRRNPGCGFVFRISSFLPFIDFLVQKNYNITIDNYSYVKEWWVVNDSWYRIIQTGITVGRFEYIDV